MKATKQNPEIINGFEVYYREAGKNSYWVAKRETINAYAPLVYTRKNKNSLVQFIKTKPARRKD